MSTEIQSPGVLRSQIIVKCSDDVPRDWSTNTVHYHINSGLTYMDTDYVNHVNQILAAFKGTASEDPGFAIYQPHDVQVKVYDLGDPGSTGNPRVPRANVSAPHTAGMAPERANFSPAQICAVLSFYAGANNPGKRGRLYIGPFPSSALSSQVSNAYQTQILALGSALFNIGGENVKHVIYHPKATQSGNTAGSYSTVSDYWVGNEWAVIRSRGIRATSRLKLHP